jgi:phage shock protein PspC (stress-responsive transcriptional regulator)
MNKVITINLGGTAYQLEEQGYDALRAYLETAATRLQGNPDRDEILSDVEQAIGEKFRGLLGSHKTVVVTKEVEAVLLEMGPVEDGSNAGGAAAEAPEVAGAAANATTDADPAAGATAGPGPAKRLYKIRDGEMIAGVCNGLGAYFNIDPTIVRLAFVGLTVVWGAGVLVYFVLALVVPTADTPEEKAAAYGAPFTTQEFVRRAKEGYYGAVKSFSDKHARREWKRQFRREMRGWRTSFHREMGAGAYQWRQHWQRHWAAGAPPGYGVALPLFSILHGGLAIAWIAVVISLLATGTLFGAALPAGVPVWVALLLGLFFYGFLVWPLKAARKAFYYGGGARRMWPVVCFVDLLVWLAVALVGVWLAIRFMPHAREAIQHAPGVFREAVQNIRDWWRG